MITTWLAITVIVSLWVLVGVVLYFARTFGAFAHAREQDAKIQQNQNLLIQQQNWHESKDLAKFRAELLAQSSQEKSA
jgi:hypothetical protein